MNWSVAYQTSLDYIKFNKKKCATGSFASMSPHKLYHSVCELVLYCIRYINIMPTYLALSCLVMFDWLWMEYMRILSYLIRYQIKQYSMRVNVVCCMMMMGDILQFCFCFSAFLCVCVCGFITSPANMYFGEKTAKYQPKFDLFFVFLFLFFSFIKLSCFPLMLVEPKWS